MAVMQSLKESTIKEKKFEPVPDYTVCDICVGQDECYLEESKKTFDSWTKEDYLRAVKVADYIKKTGNHVLYRVTPIYEKNNLLASGVTIEAKSVEDNGKGIASKDLTYIFDRFYRTDVSRNSSKGGSGIGLSIVKKILEDHGGKVWATSRLGIGTIMYFVLRKYQEVPMK